MAAAEASSAEVRTFRTKETGQVQVDFDWVNLKPRPQTVGGGHDVIARLGQSTFSFPWPTGAIHQIWNSLAVMGSLDAVGVDPAFAMRALEKFESADGRGRIQKFSVDRSQVILIDESYNANPLSMGAALSVQSTQAIPFTNVRRIAVLGDMRELGEASDRLHRELKAPIEAARIDKVFACGPFMKGLFDSLAKDIQGNWTEKSTDLIAPLLAAIRPGDVIMVKGSLGTRMAPIVEALKVHLAEWEKTGERPQSQPSS